MSFITMIVDDDPIVRRLHKSVLEYSGINSEVILSTNGLEAINFLKGHFRMDHSYLIFLDLNMPVMDGWTFLEEAEKLYPFENIRIIVLTSSIRNEDSLKARSNKLVYKYFEKPLSIEAIKLLKAEPSFLQLMYQAH